MAENRPHSTALQDSGFAVLGVPNALVRLLAADGITAPFPIQTATLPDSMAGRDVLGRGRTGSGKTYAFLLPLVTRLAADKQPRRAGRPRALILAPTRELASQIEAAAIPLAAALGLNTMTVFGGVGAGGQISKLRAGVDILVACPGRLEDHIRGGHANLGSVEITVLDEADHMADLGFLPSVRRLLEQTPRDGQRMLFSATLDGGIDSLVKKFLHNPVTHSVDSAESPVSTMSHHVLHIQHADRMSVLVDLTSAPGRTVVFARTKQRAKRLTRDLIASGVPAVEMHGNLAQNARTRNLLAFSEGTARTMVATDIAARGIHVDDIARVIHADPPVEHKAYLHRSGRTARAGAEGVVITLMTDDQVNDVRQLTRKAAINPKTSRVSPGDALLRQLAPGERKLVTPTAAQLAAPTTESNGRGRGQGQGQGQGQRRKPAAGAPARNRPRTGATADPGNREHRPRREQHGRTTTRSDSGGAAAFSQTARPRRGSAR